MWLRAFWSLQGPRPCAVLTWVGLWRAAGGRGGGHEGYEGEGLVAGAAGGGGGECAGAGSCTQFSNSQTQVSGPVKGE